MSKSKSIRIEYIICRQENLHHGIDNLRPSIFPEGMRNSITTTIDEEEGEDLEEYLDDKNVLPTIFSDLDLPLIDSMLQDDSMQKDTLQEKFYLNVASLLFEVRKICRFSVLFVISRLTMHELKLFFFSHL